MPVKEAFHDKAVVITGATSGIGRALALELAAAGARLVVAGRDPARLAEVTAACKARGARAAHGHQGDLTQPDECKRLVDAAVGALGGIDVLVNNAGVTMWADFAATTDPAWISRIMEANYYSVAYTTYHALPHIIASQGRLVAVSSVAGIVGVPGHAVYGASKHAIHGLYDSLRVELMDQGVSVTVVAPDFVVTPMHDRGVGATGQPMRRRLDARKHMSAETCARLAAEAIARRKRLLVTSPRGRLAAMLRGLAPSFLDRIARRSVRKAGLH